MTSSELEMIADGVLEYLERQGAVRIDEDNIGGYRTVLQICQAMEVDTVYWQKIKRKLNERGKRAKPQFSIVFVQGKGHYIGDVDEEITNDIHLYKMARGMVKHLRISHEKLVNATPGQRRWIERRDKDFQLQSVEELVEHGERVS